jgi:hypothetical protein
MASVRSQLRKAIRAVFYISAVRDYVFVYLGCGKGRATTVAGEFPFRTVMGVELSGALAATDPPPAAPQKNEGVSLLISC